MYKVRKRDGKLVKFEMNKISDAMKKAFEDLRETSIRNIKQIRKTLLTMINGTQLN